MKLKIVEKIAVNEVDNNTENVGIGIFDNAMNRVAQADAVSKIAGQIEAKINGKTGFKVVVKKGTGDSKTISGKRRGLYVIPTTDFIVKMTVDTKADAANFIECVSSNTGIKPHKSGKINNNPNYEQEVNNKISGAISFIKNRLVLNSTFNTQPTQEFFKPFDDVLNKIGNMIKQGRDKKKTKAELSALAELIINSIKQDKDIGESNTISGIKFTITPKIIEAEEKIEIIINSNIMCYMNFQQDSNNAKNVTISNLYGTTGHEINSIKQKPVDEILKRLGNVLGVPALGTVTQQTTSSATPGSTNTSSNSTQDQDNSTQSGDSNSFTKLYPNLAKSKYKNIIEQHKLNITNFTESVRNIGGKCVPVWNELGKEPDRPAMLDLIKYVLIEEMKIKPKLLKEKNVANDNELGEIYDYIVEGNKKLNSFKVLFLFYYIKLYKFDNKVINIIDNNYKEIKNAYTEGGKGRKFIEATKKINELSVGNNSENTQTPQSGEQSTETNDKMEKVKKSIGELSIEQLTELQEYIAGKLKNNGTVTD